MTPPAVAIAVGNLPPKRRKSGKTLDKSPVSIQRSGRLLPGSSLFTRYFSFSLFRLPITGFFAMQSERPTAKSQKQGCFLNHDIHFINRSMQFVNDSMQFLDDSMRFVNDSMRFVNDSMRFVNGGMHFLNDSMQFVNGGMRFLNDSMQFVNGGMRFLNDSMR